MSTSIIDNKIEKAKADIKHAASFTAYILIVTLTFLIVGVAGTLVLEAGSHAHYAFVILLIAVVAWLV
jgi:hypothetical protein